MVQQPLGGRGLHIIEISRSHLVGILWTSDQLETETSNWQYTTFTRGRYPCPGGIRTSNFSR